MKYTTTNLRLDARSWWRIHERTIRDAAWGAAMVVTLLLIHNLLSPADAAAPLTPIVREQLRPAMLIATATPAPPLPTTTPWPTPEPIIVEVPGPAPAPEVIYVEVPVAPVVDAAPTLPPAVEPPAADWYATPVAAPAAAPVQWATSGPVRKEDFKEPNRAATCAFVGCLGR